MRRNVLNKTVKERTGGKNLLTKAIAIAEGEKKHINATDAEGKSVYRQHRCWKGRSAGRVALATQLPERGTKGDRGEKTEERPCTVHLGIFSSSSGANRKRVKVKGRHVGGKKSGLNQGKNPIKETLEENYAALSERHTTYVIRVPVSQGGRKRKPQEKRGKEKSRG